MATGNLKLNIKSYVSLKLMFGEGAFIPFDVRLRSRTDEVGSSLARGRGHVGQFLE